MINIKLTSVQGTQKIVQVNTIKDVLYFVQEYPKKIKQGARVRVDCDIAGINGWITGTHS